MSIWWSTHSVSLALYVASGVQFIQRRAESLADPRSLRRARAQVVRVITVVAGH